MYSRSTFSHYLFELDHIFETLPSSMCCRPSNLLNIPASWYKTLLLISGVQKVNVPAVKLDHDAIFRHSNCWSSNCVFLLFCLGIQ